LKNYFLSWRELQTLLRADGYRTLVEDIARFEKIKAGASAVQIYTGFVYEGRRQSNG
jgi:dihydroorotate dehydrogenase